MSIDAGAANDGRGGDAVLERRDQGEGLEGRPRLAARCRPRRSRGSRGPRPRPSSSRRPCRPPSPARIRCEGRGPSWRAVGVARVREHRADRGLRARLRSGIERGRDAAGPPVNRSLYRVVRASAPNAGFAEEPLLEVVDEVGVAVALDRASPRRSTIGSRGRPRGLVARDHAPARASAAARRCAGRARDADARTGSKWLGAVISPASIADCASVRSSASIAEVGLCGGLHAVGALAEVDRVQVLREDLVLRAGDPRAARRATPRRSCGGRCPSSPT